MRNLTIGEIYLLTVSITILNVLDVLTTLIGLSLGAKELNPYFRNGYNTFNLPSKLLFVSLVNCALSALYSKVSLSRDKHIITLSLLIMFFFFGLAVLN